MKKILIIIFSCMTFLGYSEDQGGTLYFVPGVLKVVGEYNGIKLITCSPPFENHICYSFIIQNNNNGGSTELLVNYDGNCFKAQGSVSSLIGEDGSITYLFNKIQ